MNRPIDITGVRFGKLTAIEVTGSHKKGRLWRCSCDCGGEAIVPTGRLKNGWTKSCGCAKVEHGRRLGVASATHGLSHKSSEYNIWAGMKARCYNRRSASWLRYGGRGIDVCARWRDDFEAFLADMGLRPGREYSLDRIDVNKGYSPENCRWATQAEQQNNRRDNLMIEAFGDCMTPSQWEARFGVSASTIRNRLSAGWGAEDAVSKPKRVLSRD